MNNNSAIPDAWDDDWESLADKHEAADSVSNREPTKKLTRAERRAQQEELNKQLWQEAEAPKTFHFLESRANVPLKSDFKPTMTLLSRKTNQSNSLSHQSAANPVAGMENLNVNDAEEESSEGETQKQPTLTPEERHAQIQRDRELKQRQYDEARGRIFGTSGTGSGASTPGSMTPPRDRSTNKNKGRGKAMNSNQQDDMGRPGSAGMGKQLYDPSYSAKPDSVYLQKREKTSGTKEDEEEQKSVPVRQPRQPDGTPGFHHRKASSLAL